MKLQGCLRSGSIFQNEAAPRAILGGDILCPHEVAEALGPSYSKEQLEQLAAALPSEEVLRSLKKSNYGLLPTPPNPMSLLDVRELKPDLFCSKSGEWYAAQNFARVERTAFGWLAIQKDIVQKSTGKNWDEQRSMLGSEESVPNAAEFAWFITTYYAVRGVRLFTSIYARTSSVGSGDSRVSVGSFGKDGFNVYRWWGGSRSDILGVSSVRILTLS